MPARASRRQELHAVPRFPHESLYVGIDVGKLTHIAGFVSNTLLQTHGRFEGCPVLKFKNSREGFRALVDRIRELVPLEQSFLLLEQTGHYHRAVVQYLQELDLSVYLMHVQSRPVGLLKTDKRDALGLANHLYNQLEKGIQVADKSQLVRRAVPSSEAAVFLRGLARHRYELIHESTQRKDKLTAICDELFPEFTEIFKNPNLPAALTIREHFPTPYALALASQDALRTGRRGNYPSNANLARLQQLAGQSIGTKDLARQRSLVIEQSQLIRELLVMQEHLACLDAEIRQVVEQSREGKILTSIPGVGLVQAGTLIAALGHIGNFRNAAALRAYLGWAPQVERSGTSLDRTHLGHGGLRTTKQMMFLVVGQAIQIKGAEWAQLYERLVPRMCRYDESTREYKGKLKVIARIAGQMIGLMYRLLKQDAELLAKTSAGTSPPEPVLYDPVLHHAHRHGEYRSRKSQARTGTVVQLAKH